MRVLSPSRTAQVYYKVSEELNKSSITTSTTTTEVETTQEGPSGIDVVDSDSSFPEAR